MVNKLLKVCKLKDRQLKKLSLLNKSFIKFTQNNSMIKSTQPSQILPTNQLIISSNNSFLSLLLTKKLKSLWDQFWNKFSNISNKSISLKLCNKRNLNLENSINTFTKDKIKILSNSIKMISSLFTVTLLF